MLRAHLEQVVRGRSLSRDEARSAMLAIMGGAATDAQIAGLLVALRCKGESVDEIVGFAESMREVANHLDLRVRGLVDTCGTGGDGAGTFNISTAAALIAAGAGVPIAKHGNRAVSSACGSADVLEALGVRLVSAQDALRACLEGAGFAFLFAPAQHPAMKHAIGPRRELGLRTVFNLLGPLTNPAGARRQVVGVYDPALVGPLAEVLGRLGAERALVAHGAGGLDEISTLGPTEIAEWDGARVLRYRIDPEELGLGIARPHDLQGGDGAANARALRAVLEGEAGPRRDIVLLNAAAALLVGERAGSLAEGLEMARASVDGGAAAAALERLVAISGREAAAP